MTAKKQLNVRVPEMTEKQIAELQRFTGMTITQIIIIAVSNLHAEFVTPDATSKGNK